MLRHSEGCHPSTAISQDVMTNIIRRQPRFFAAPILHCNNFNLMERKDFIQHAKQLQQKAVKKHLEGYVFRKHLCTYLSDIFSSTAKIHEVNINKVRSMTNCNSFLFEGVLRAHCYYLTQFGVLKIKQSFVYMIIDFLFAILKLNGQLKHINVLPTHPPIRGIIILLQEHNIIASISTISKLAFPSAGDYADTRLFRICTYQGS